MRASICRGDTRRGRSRTLHARQQGKLCTFHVFVIVSHSLCVLQNDILRFAVGNGRVASRERGEPVDRSAFRCTKIYTLAALDGFDAR